ncbi:MAG: aminotransferase class I/II-fold pyridoxal phosphate-dependent enzyme, partial [Clostridia bacterium]|nr:aminotransferase class I/II-fold pyridoxal phosphate-dependent enzyme [Clostridia bacterium]
RLTMYDFDKVYTKREPGNCKWDVEKGCIALSVADMDFASPPEVTKALVERVSTGLYGYEMMTERDYQAIIDWRFKRHGEVIKREHLMATPGVLNTMRAALYALTNEGDKVIVMPPLHTPSITSASMRGRVCVEVLMNDDGNGYYTLNYEGIEQAFKDGAKVLMFCSPSNPSGRVWKKEELERLAQIVIKYNGYVIADEIHADIVYKGHKFISLRLIEGMEDRSVCVFSPSKSFNFGGFHIGSVVVKDDALRKKIKDILYETGNVCGRPTAMSICAQTAAYTQGGAWLDELLEYLQANIDVV